MRLISRALIVSLAILTHQVSWADETGMTSSISVDYTTIKRVIPQLFFGQNLETTRTESLLASDGGLDPEIVGLLSQANITSLRFPGGTGADHFHWWQALGPVSGRPLQGSGNIVKQDGQEDRAELYRPIIGPEEFIELSIALRAVPFITANTGSGSAEEAEAWAIYFNSVGFPVQFWEIGNEPYFLGINESGVLGLTPDAYAEMFIEYATKIRAIVPGARIFAAGLTGPDAEESFWNSVMLGIAGPHVDGLSLHNAYAPLYAYTPERTIPSEEYIYTAMFGATKAFEGALADVAAETARRGRLIPIFVTEYDGIFFPEEDVEPVEKTLARNPTLACALYNASALHVMMRNERVRGAHHMALVGNLYGSLVGIDGSTRLLNPQFYVHREYAKEAHHVLVQTAVDPQNAHFDSGAIRETPAQTDVPILDAIATRDLPGGYHSLYVVNRSLSETVTTNVETNLDTEGRTATVTVLTGPAYDAKNDAENPTRVSPQTQPFLGGNSFNYEFPPYSLTIFRWTEASE